MQIDDFESIRLSAEQGDPWKQWLLGVCYATGGYGVPQSHTVAAYWYRKAAEQGFEVAQNLLGSSYAAGNGVPQSHTEAAYWYRKAAEQGFHGAQYNLANAYRLGQGVPQSHTEAVKWYRKAAEQGIAVAQKRLGDCYEKGLGVPQNDTEAAYWRRKAAEPSPKDTKARCFRYLFAAALVFIFIYVMFKILS